MRLICGVVRLDGAGAEDATLAAMAAALTSPGLTPRVARHVDGPAALAVMDFSARQPIAVAVGSNGVRLAADVRLDRPHELAASLDLPHNAGPEAMMLAALDRWGDAVSDRVDGDFALAAWDPRQRRLTCARDIVGARPLCYSYEPGRFFAFASLPRGLHASGVVPHRPDLVALGCMLVRSYPFGEQTGFTGIHWLCAGHGLVVTPNGLTVRRVWQPDPAQVGRWRGSAADAAATLRTLVEEAVACRLPGGEPVAAHLSGGLDSSAIAVIAARQARARDQRLYAFSKLSRLSAGSGARDEQEYVDAVLAQEPDIRWSAARSASYDSAGTVEPDLPLAGALAQPDDWICALAAAAGCRLLLSGAGGDEGATYSGSAIIVDLLRQGRWGRVRTELRARADRSGKNVVTVAAADLIRPLMPGWLGQLRRLLRRQPVPNGRRNALSFLRPPFAHQADQALPQDHPRGSGPLARIQRLTEDPLGAHADRWAVLGARHGLAFSYPLADRRVLEFALSLPIERLLDGGFSRQPYRNAMRGILPESICWRDTKFSTFPDMPINLAASTAGLLASVENVRRSAAAAAFVDLDAVAAALAAVPHDAEARAAAFIMNDASFSHIPRTFKMGLHATRALILAEHLARASR